MVVFGAMLGLELGLGSDLGSLVLEKIRVRVQVWGTLLGLGPILW